MERTLTFYIEEIEDRIELEHTGYCIETVKKKTTIVRRWRKSGGKVSSFVSTVAKTEWLRCGGERKRRGRKRDVTKYESADYTFNENLLLEYFWKRKHREQLAPNQMAGMWVTLTIAYSVQNSIWTRYESFLVE